VHPIRAPSRKPSVVFATWKLAHYQVRMLPPIRRSIRRWQQRAQDIPSPELRRDAVETIVRKVTYLEAAAAFATLAPPASRTAAIEFIVAWQIICDYVDALGERRARDVFANNMQLHHALVAAVDLEQPLVDYYADHPYGEDGGYLHELVTTCRGRIATLPLSAALQPLASAAAQRCREAQSHTHAIGSSGATDALERWCDSQPGRQGYEWWEIAAAGISDIAIPPLVAAAASHATTPEALTRIHDAYWPHVCALSVLLDSIADQDLDTDDFSFIAHYPTPAALRAGLAKTTRNASRAANALPDAAVHHGIVASTIAYYATHGPDTPELIATLRPSFDELRPTTTLIACALRLQDAMRRR